MSENMGRDYRLLLVCNINDNHIIRFIRYLKTNNPEARIDVFCKHARLPIDSSLNGQIDHLIVANADGQLGSSENVFSQILRYMRTFRALFRLSGNNYDVINIHYPTWAHLFYINHLKTKNNFILLTPWGSDVYRASKKTFFILKRVYKKADYVCGTDNRFSHDVKRFFNLNKEKIAYLDIGSETIDVICDNLNTVSREQAKQKLGVEEKYVITCGYNGSKAQNHRIIIDAILKNKDKLPKDIILFFPFTYAGTKEYCDELKDYLSGLGLNYLFFEDYLDLQNLFILRRSADMFIHIQTTDANAATIQEYLLCGAKVINGQWLRYSELERNGVVPYFIADSVDSLSEAIEKACDSEPIVLPEDTLAYIKGYGWKSWILKWDSFFCSLIRN